MVMIASLLIVSANNLHLTAAKQTNSIRNIIVYSLNICLLNLLDECSDNCSMITQKTNRLSTCGQLVFNLCCSAETEDYKRAFVLLGSIFRTDTPTSLFVFP